MHNHFSFSWWDRLVIVKEGPMMDLEEDPISSVVIVPPLGDIDDMLTLMNTARTVYRRARSREVRKLAERQFNHCYDWFIRHQISISYDTYSQQWSIDRHGGESLLPFIVAEAINLRPHDLPTNGGAARTGEEV